MYINVSVDSTSVWTWKPFSLPITVFMMSKTKLNGLIVNGQCGFCFRQNGKNQMKGFGLSIILKYPSYPFMW